MKQVIPPNCKLHALSRRAEDLARRVDHIETETQGEMQHIVERLSHYVKRVFEGLWSNHDLNHYRWEPFKHYKTPKIMTLKKERIRIQLWGRHKGQVREVLMRALESLDDPERQELVNALLLMREHLYAYSEATAQAESVVDTIHKNDFVSLLEKIEQGELP